MATKKTHTQEMDKARTTPDSTDALEAIALRNIFYYTSYKYLVIFNVLLAIIIGLLLGFIGTQHYLSPTPTYFATDPEGFLLDPVERGETLPTWSDNFIINWGTNAAIKLNAYNFANYREAFQKMRQHFTPRGYRLYLLALKESLNLDLVKADKLIVSGRPTGPLKIINQAKTGSGAHYWEVEIPMLVNYQNKQKTITQRILMKMTILRMSTLEYTSGIAIAQIVIWIEE